MGVRPSPTGVEPTPFLYLERMRRKRTACRRRGRPPITRNPRRRTTTLRMIMGESATSKVFCTFSFVFLFLCLWLQKVGGGGGLGWSSNWDWGGDMHTFIGNWRLDGDVNVCVCLKCLPIGDIDMTFHRKGCTQHWGRSPNGN